MTRKETAVILDMLTAVYPKYYAKDVDMGKQLKLWAEMFVNEDADRVSNAVREFIAADVKGFPPQIGAIKEQLRSAEPSSGKSWQSRVTETQPDVDDRRSVSRYAREHGLTWQEAKAILDGKANAQRGGEIYEQT